ncbi:MAG: RIP metalloprotease RseP [Methylomonas sp.]|jgi:regulator of sigma E protease|uniref:RIP metalloprotease RseP n=1 Tax=Methylomonas sp. TaxID=418 RepID=UPI0025F1E514|nr:RIP metalloprotease RseP [Methylomonas sp.]MCK9605821.1 RIP metalloprotease RseP [Methylomonas sp.]
METLHTLFYFSVAIAVLVAFHELGHFWVARLTGVKVIRFSIGFGKKLWAYQKAPEQTEFVVSAIPLGGYVKMVDEREGEVVAADLPYAFNRQSVGVRTLIVAAGPVFNLILAVILFWVVMVVGETGLKPVLGEVTTGTLAAEAGFQAGDQIISVNQKPTPTWAMALDALFSLAIDGQRDIVVDVITRDDQKQFRALVLTDGDVQSPEVLNERLGLKPFLPVIKPIIGKLMEDGSAKQAGLQTGDLIVRADDQPIEDWQQWVDYIQAKPDVEINVTLERNEVQTQIKLTPRKEEQADGKVVGKIGAGVEIPEAMMRDLQVEYSLSPLEAIPAAFEKTWFYSLSTVKMIGKMFVGSASVKNLSGPISIAQYAGQSAEMGFTAFLKFLGLISVSLGVLNLLPVPVLDGGHLLFYALEVIKGSPVSDRVQMVFQQMGMLVLMSLMALALFLDLDRLFQ